MQDEQIKKILDVSVRASLYESIRATKIDTDALDEADTLTAFQSLLILQDPPNP